MDDLKRELIKKHLHGWYGGAHASIKHFCESGKASGTFSTALKAMMNEYAERSRDMDEKTLAIEFAEWILNSLARKATITSHQWFLATSSGKRYHTTDELYDIFEIETGRKKG